MSLAQIAIAIFRGYPKKDTRKAFVLNLILLREWGETKGTFERGHGVTLFFRDGSELTLDMNFKPVPQEIFQC